MSHFTCPSCGERLSESKCQCLMCGKLLNGSMKHPEPIALTAACLEEEKKVFTEEEIIAGIEEIERTGGLKLVDFIQELEAEAARRE